MIWALLEITLPLFLTFIFGLCAGWLFWRWRRRQISQTEWDKHTQNNAAKARIDSALNFSSPQSGGDLEALQAKLAQANVDKADVERKLQDASSRSEHQSKLTDELQQKLKQSETVASERDSAIAKNKELEEKLSEWDRKSFEQETNNNTANDEEKSALQEQILKLQSELEQSSAKSSDSAADKQKLEALESHLIQANDTAEEEQRNLQGQIKNLQSELTQARTQASDSAAYKQRLEALEPQLKQAHDTAEEEQRSLQNKIESLQTELQEARVEAADSAEDKQKLRALEAKLIQTSDAAAENQQSLQDQIQKLKSELDEAHEQASKNAAADQQKLKELESQLTEARDISDTEKRGLQDNIQKLQSELEQARAQTSDSAADKAKLKTLESQLQETTESAEKEQHKLQENIQKLKSLLEQARSQASESSADKQKLRVLESQLEQANNAASELNTAKIDIANLNSQLNKSRMELAQKTETNSTDSQQANKHARENAELARQLQQVKTEVGELREARGKVTELTAQLNKVREHNRQLRVNNAAAAKPAAAPITPIDVGKIKKLEKENAEKDQQIADLLKKAKARKNQPKAAKTTSKKTDWQKGKTKLGTPGSNHKDDLTAINGIGPKIEKVLNRLGIKSLEQIATFKVAEVKLVDEALVDFSGRIQRDEWVAQAKALVRNGHQPLNAKTSRSKTATKKPKKSKSSKTAWQSGKTKFGTPGSKHRDDLKVVNGIGPVIEKALNRFGIKSWEQLATLKVKEVKAIDEALDFPGRIQREQWVQQAKALVKEFPDNKDRPTRRTFLNQAAAG